MVLSNTATRATTMMTTATTKTPFVKLRILYHHFSRLKKRLSMCCVPLRTTDALLLRLVLNSQDSRLSPSD
jgi:hypothetical protein